MSEMRKQFEALPSIKTFLMSFDYNEKSGEYVRSKLFTQPDYTLGFFNGAWYAFQEQQKKIDSVLQYIDDEKWMDEYGDDHCPVLKIQELLK